MLLVAHDVNPLLGYLDQVIYIAGGRATSGSVDEVITPDTLSALYGAPIEVLKTADGRLVVVGQPEAPHHHGDRHGRTTTITTDTMNPTLSLNPSTTSRAVHVPVHGQRARGRDDRRGPGGGRRLVHGAPPPELRRPHAVGDGVPGRDRRRARRPADRARLLPRLRRRGAGSCAEPADRRASARPAAATAPRPRRSAPSRRSDWPPGTCSCRSTTPCSAAPRRCCSGRSSASAAARCWRCCWSRSSPWRWSRSATRPLLLETIDPRGSPAPAALPVAALDLGFLLVLALAVAATSQITGALLVFALLVAPPAAAQQLTMRPGLGLVLSVVFALAGRVARARDRVLLDLSGRLLRHELRVRPLPAGAARVEPRRGRR